MTHSVIPEMRKHLRFSSNSEANVSEWLVNFEEMFSRYYMCSDVVDMLKSLITQQFVIRRERVKDMLIPLPFGDFDHDPYIVTYSWIHLLMQDKKYIFNMFLQF